MKKEKRNFSNILSDLEKGYSLPESESGFYTIWEAAENFEYPQLNVDKAWMQLTDRIHPQAAPKPLKVNYFKTWAVAASLALLCAFGAIYYYQSVQITPVEYVATSQNKIITLNDGTQITLNHNSKVITDSKFGSKHRNITLQGEAFFDVSKNKELPFVVTTGNLETKVTGTHFNINAFTQNLVKVALTEGSVELNFIQHKVAVLKPGDLAIANQLTNEVSISSFNSNSILAWLDSKLEFVNEPLSDVVERLEHVLGVKFIYPKSMSTVLITTSFPNLDPDLAAAILSKTLETEVKVVK
ncbi:MAG: FecR domain-containing protein [Bacteroidia bacterium]|jgi:ferric-dicitrate binding protein FerR (iron transport regulator)|nr:FecR domain-containing protein [Bacteroidia bacterium]